MQRRCSAYVSRFTNALCFQLGQLDVRRSPYLVCGRIGDLPPWRRTTTAIGRVSLARENEAGGSWGQKVHILHVNV